MPRIGYSEEYSDNSKPDAYLRLKLVKDERKRILCFEGPWFEWVHELRLPKIMDGQAVFELVKRKDGSSWQKWTKEFLGNAICIGNPQVLQDKGLDAANCPACAGSERSQDIPRARRRYAMTVFIYNMTSNGAQLIQPYGGQLAIWSFTSGMYDKLREFQKEWGDLRNHDLKLGPLEDGIPVDFQRHPTEVAQEALWQYNEMTRAVTAQTISGPGNRPTDDQLQYACGRPTTLAYLTADVERAENAWRQAKAPVNAPLSPQAGAAAFAPQQTLQQDFAGILQGPLSPQPQFAQGGPVQADPFAAVQGYQPQPAQPQFTPPAVHPLEAQAAAASQAQASDPFALQGFQPQAQPTQQFAPQAQPAQQAPQPQYADPFAAIQPQPAQPQFAQQPQAPAPSGLDEFAAQTTMNPGPQAQAVQQQFAPQPMQPQPMQPQAPAPQAPAGSDVNFDELFNTSNLG